MSTRFDGLQQTQAGDVRIGRFVKQEPVQMSVQEAALSRRAEQEHEQIGGDVRHENGPAT